MSRLPAEIRTQRLLLRLPGPEDAEELNRALRTSQAELSAWMDWAVPKFEIGYWCRTDKVGQGFVSEATLALAQHAFLGLGAKRVALRMDDRNRRSRSVAERLGFVHEATLKNNDRATDGSLRDTRVYAAFSLTDLSAVRAYREC